MPFALLLISDILLSQISKLCLSNSSDAHDNAPVSVIKRDVIQKARQKFVVEIMLLNTSIEDGIKNCIRTLSEHFDVAQLANCTIDVIFHGPQDLNQKVHRYLHTSNQSNGMMIALQNAYKNSSRYCDTLTHSGTKRIRC